jgi:hypothetical protein
LRVAQLIIKNLHHRGRGPEFTEGPDTVKVTIPEIAFDYGVEKEVTFYTDKYGARAWLQREILKCGEGKLIEKITW